MTYKRNEIRRIILDAYNNNPGVEQKDIAHALNRAGLTTIRGSSYRQSTVSQFISKQMTDVDKRSIGFPFRKENKKASKKVKKKKATTVTVVPNINTTLLQGLAETQVKLQDNIDVTATMNKSVELLAQNMGRVKEVAENIETRTTRKYRQSNQLYFLLAILVSFNTALNLFPLETPFFANCLMTLLLVNIAFSVRGILK